MSFLTTAIYMAEAALGIGLIIFLHEAGHFMIARWCGVRVEVFSLGFGPRLVGWRRGPTDYRVSLVPFGGYVKMAGENAAMAGTGAPDEFPSKTVGQRALIASGGVIMNILTAAVFFILAFLFGVKFMVPEVGPLPPGSAAEQIGLMEGDRLVSYDGEPIRYFNQLQMAIAFSDPDDEVELVVRRDGEEGPRDLTLRFRPEISEVRGAPELEGLSPRIAAVVRKVYDEGAAATTRLAADGTAFPLEKGDLITSMAGRAIGPFGGSEVLRAIQDHAGETIPVTILRGSDVETLTVDGGPPTLEWVGGEIFELSMDVGAEARRGIGAYPAEHPVVGDEIIPGAAAHGVLRKGDTILMVNGEDSRIRSIWNETAYGRGRPIDVVVRRGEEELALQVTPRFARSGYALGILPSSPKIVGRIDPGSPAEKAGLREGDEIVTLEDVDEKAVRNWWKLESYIAATEEPEKPVLVVKRGEETLELPVEPVPQPDLVAGTAGIGLGFPYFTLRSANLLEATALGMQGTIDWIGKVFLTIKSLASRTVSPENLGGIVMIAESSYQFASMGFGTILYFLGIISVNLAILNILPIPVLDGGLLLFLLLEKLKGKPVDEKYMVIANYVGMALLLVLMVYVTKNDIVRIIGRGG